MSFTDILVVTLLGIALILGLLALFGKIKIVIVYRKEEQTAPWKEEDDESVSNYVKLLETAKPPTLAETVKRKRGRPRKVRPVSPLIPPTA
jgi:hypothetical protein